jgi:hypothetical protein
VESLFELIMSNLFFVIIVIGGLISFFNRMSNGGESDERPQRHERSAQRGQHPTGQRQQEETVDWREIFKQEQPSQPEATNQETVRPVSFEPVSDAHEEVSKGVDRQQELYDRYERLKDKKRDAVKRFEKTVKPASGETSQNPSKLDLQLNRLSNQEAMKAVVWAEVLGKPRGKNPHQAFMQSKR